MIEQIFDDFYRITLPLPFRLKHVHVFALVHDRKVALFDTGVNFPETLIELEKSLEIIGRSVCDIDQVFISHFHADHCGIAGKIQEISGAKIHMSKIDGQRIYNDQSGKLDERLLRTFYTKQGLSKNIIDSLIRLLNSFRLATAPFSIGRFFKNYEKYTIGNTQFEIIPASGHTRGQVCFFFQNEGVLLSADHVLPQITPNLSPDPYSRGFRPLKSYLTSLKILKPFPAVRVYPAHGDHFTGLNTRIEEIEEHHRERKNLIYDSLKDGNKSTFEISQKIFGEILSEFDQFLAVNETYSHLIELESEGSIRRAHNEGNQVLLFGISPSLMK